MIWLLCFNLFLVAISLGLSNEVLRWHGYVLYGLQLATLVPYLLWRGVFAKNFFQPTVFALGYTLVNLTLGGYLVPRGFGWYKGYSEVALAIETYRLIVPYFLLANLAVFLVACRTIRRLARTSTYASAFEGTRSSLSPISELALLGAFLGISAGGVYSLFSFQMALALIHLTDVMRARAPYRLIVAGAYLIGMVAFSFDNKREIAMVLFLVLFLETYYGRQVLTLSPKSIAGYVGGAVAFLALVLTASILRGYGSFQVTSVAGAITALPRYVSSDVFVDGITDNLELNFSYGSAIAAIDLTLHGNISFQYGASIWKVLFLPISRDILPAKPESVMQLFTKAYAPTMWANEGSLPVMFSSEAFVNFGVLGLLMLVLVWLGIDSLFLQLHRSKPHSLGYYSTTFLVLTVLMFTRGSGLEQYFLYFVVALPLLALTAGLMHARVRPMSRAYSQ